MKIGRNDPCPCGSGKKYKKCCLRKDEEEALKARSESHENPLAEESEEFEDIPGIAEFDDPEDAEDDFYDEETEKFWNDFRAADFRGRLEIIEKVFEDPDIWDTDDFFELFNSLDEMVSDSEKRKIFRDLTMRLKNELPEIYGGLAEYLLNSCITNALLDGQEQEAFRLFKEFARIADKDIDEFNATLEQMAYYGDLALVVEAVRIAWEGIGDSSDIMPWGIDEFSMLACDYEFFDYISEAPNPGPTDNALMERLESYIEGVDQEVFSEYFAHVTGTSDRKWESADFIRKTGKKRKGGVSRTLLLENISHLANAFLCHLCRKENMPYPRAEMIRTEIRTYLRDRVLGELEKKSGLLESMMDKSKKKIRTPISNYEHALCPDNTTLDLFIARKFHMLGSQPYKAAACMEGIPIWLRFVESLGLIDADLHRRTSDSVSKLLPDVERILTKYRGEKEAFVFDNLKQAWGDMADSAG